MSETTSGATASRSPTPRAHGGSADRLGPFLCWAVVFADIGTSVYYVPGILYSQVGRLAGVFVTMTLVVFLLLTIKYAEATVRFPEGGGEVAVASRGLNPWFGALGGMFILIDYFLTASISSLSGLHYFQVIFPPIAPYVVGLTLAVIIALGILNWWGIQESATVSAAIACLAFLSSVVIVLLVLTHVPLQDIGLVFREIFSGGHLTGITILTGFAGAFLAFSGLESIAQLAPVMRVPRRKTVNAALTFVVITVGLTGPLLTIFSTVLLTDPRFRDTMARPAYSVDANPDQFISLLAGAYGGVMLAVATAIIASALLIFAANTAIIGAYHVVLALARMRYFPRVMERRNKLRGTPHIAIAIATLTPVVVLLLVQGNINLLGELYGFGLLGAFLLLCVSLDVIRWRERHGSPPIGATVDPELLRYGSRNGRNGVVMTPPPAPESPLIRRARALLGQDNLDRLTQARTAVHSHLRPIRIPVRRWWKAHWLNVKYVLGFITTALVAVAWATNLFGKPLATIFGSALTAIGMGVAALHFRYQQVRHPIVFLDTPLPAPRSSLVILTPQDERNRIVIQDALASADTHPPIFLYIAAASDLPPPRLFEIRDRFGLDAEAQLTLSRARRACNEARVQAKYLYAVGGSQEVFDIAALVRPAEITAEAQTARRILHKTRSQAGIALSPDYVITHLLDGARVAHNVMHPLYSFGDGRGNGGSALK
jgi:amino acid transporter